MNPEALDRRVALLEQRAARLRVVALLAVLLAAVTPAWLLLREPPALDEGRLWVARDDAGRIRAMFGLTQDGVGLTMYDSTGQMRLDLGLAPGGVPGLMLLSPRGEPVATLNLLKDGAPTLRLSDFVERARLELRPSSQTSLQPVEPQPPDTLIARRPPS